MKKLTAEEFATKVMENGTELEPETETKILVYAHINDDGELAPCTEQEFFTAYEKAHEAKFGEAWELSKPNPCY